MDKLRKYTPVAIAVLALALGSWSTWKTFPDSGPKPEPQPKPLIEPTDERPLIVADKVVIPDRGMIRLPLKTLGTIRVVEYPGISKSLQVEQFGSDVLLSRRSQVAEDCYLGLQCEHKGSVGPVSWVLCEMNLAPLPPPTPEPKPEPKPEPEPKPDPAPIPGDGLRLLIVAEMTSGGTQLSRKQQNEIFGADFQSWLNAHCAKGPDGKTAEWRIWDKDTPLANAPEIWRQAMGRVNAYPGIVISNGKTGFVGPLPEGGAILDLIKKYGG